MSKPWLEHSTSIKTHHISDLIWGERTHVRKKTTCYLSDLRLDLAEKEHISEKTLLMQFSLIVGSGWLTLQVEFQTFTSQLTNVIFTDQPYPTDHQGHV